MAAKNIGADVRIEQLPIERDKLGEGPFWDHRIAALYWVDHLGPTVRRYVPRTGEVQAWTLPRKIGCAGLTSNPDRLVVALAEEFGFLDLRSGDYEQIRSVPQSRPAIRLSDGRVDRDGGFVVGSAVTDFAGQEGAIYRLNPDLSVEVLREGLMLTNAICFHPDGHRMHFTDTRSGIVMACGYGQGSGSGEPWPFGDARDHGASPDGATVDSEGGVWVAQIRTGDIVRFTSNGDFDRSFKLPVPHATSVCFGGAKLDVLYATTVRETGMQIRSDHPQAGAVFAIHDLGFRGVEEGIFGTSRRYPAGAATENPGASL